MNNRRFHTSLTTIGIFVTSAVIVRSTIAAPAFAIKNFFNCMTDIANKHGKLTIDDVNMCLHKEYHVYHNLPYGIHNHSFNHGGNSMHDYRNTHYISKCVQDIVCAIYLSVSVQYSLV
jgi:hypothetical protein